MCVNQITCRKSCCWCSKLCFRCRKSCCWCSILSCASEIVNPAVTGVLSCASEVVNPAVGVLSCASHVVNPAVGVLSCASEVVNPAVTSVLSCASHVVNPAVGVGNSAPGALNPAPDNLHQATGEVRTVCFGTKAALFSKERMFFDSDSLGTFVEPKCGGCLCTKCPVPGSKYSFTEQKEFDIISKKLFYDEQNKRWCTELPWRYERSTLPRNKDVALKSLIATERNLFRNPEWAETYCAQIQDMVDRGSAVMLTRKEIDERAGDYHYLPHLAVRQLTKTTPVRLCFDASRKQKGYPSMNDCLHKGPDRFVSNLLAVFVGFRNGRVGCAADISKFHNRVFLVEKDVHMQRFLWRDLELENEPKKYTVTVNNFGVKPANCIATLALHKSADMFSEKYPQESEDLKFQTYIDDELVAASNREEAVEKTRRMDEICEHAGMPNKGWTYSGDHRNSDVVIGGKIDVLEERVLGLSWVPGKDDFKFPVSLSLAEGGKRRNTGPKYSRI